MQTYLYKGQGSSLNGDQRPASECLNTVSSGIALVILPQVTESFIAFFTNPPHPGRTIRMLSVYFSHESPLVMVFEDMGFFTVNLRGSSKSD